LKDETSGKHKFKCYLHGKYNEIDVLVLPAFSPLASGVPVNKHMKHRFMSEWLNGFDTDEFIPIVVDSGEVLEFPPLKDLDPVEIYDPDHTGF
jgi:metallophosphoesterase superfamily enzyme